MYLLKIDDMLMKLYYFYQKLPKPLCELKHMSEAWKKSVLKPSKSRLKVIVHIGLTTSLNLCK